MKLKEKLMHEAGDKRAEEGKKRFPLLNPAGFDNNATTFKEGFLAGFEKAKEMAGLIFEDGGSSKEISTLGEEEVE